MKTHTIYRKPNSNDFGSPCVTTDGFTGLLEVTMQQHKNRCSLFVGSKDVMYYREFRRNGHVLSPLERCEQWFNNVAFKWETVTKETLEACGFKRVED